MALRFIRKPSDTPNVNNADDARMIRYAYGGYDGYVKGKGAELSHSIAGTTFRINSGVVSLQGYESEVDANGWTMTVISGSPTKHHYAVYYEVNLATQATKIDSTVSTSSPPDIPSSVDLTSNSTGAARLLLYRFTVTNSVIAEVDKIVAAMKYVRTLLSDILSILHPIGSIYLSVNNINPSTFIGGSWVVFGQGRTLVGVDITQTEFNTVEKTGGEKTHTLAVTEMPPHTHFLRMDNGSTGQYKALPAYKLTAQSDQFYETQPMSSSTYGNPHNNLQPYITCYMFKRIG